MPTSQGWYIEHTRKRNVPDGDVNSDQGKGEYQSGVTVTLFCPVLQAPTMTDTGRFDPVQRFVGADASASAAGNGRPD